MDLILENLRNPALLFFVLGLISVHLKSDLEIPPNSAKFISLYLIFAIGFKGGQELSHSHLDFEIFASLFSGILLAIVVPLIAFFILKQKLDIPTSGAVAASYGSVSAVTFVTAVAFLEAHQIEFGGHMIAVMAMMEAPSIIVGVILIGLFDKVNQREPGELKTVIHHALTNGSVLLIMGSMLIGFVASESQAEGIRPFTTDIFKGFLAVFLLDMGITSGKKLKDLFKNGKFTSFFATVMPIALGCIMAWGSGVFIESVGNRFLFAILAASASYIAVPAAMKIAAPRANPSIYIPMALALTFPINITLGIPLYYAIIA